MFETIAIVVILGYFGYLAGILIIFAFLLKKSEKIG